MWKKVLVPLVIMIGAITCLGLHNYQMKAASNYLVGGNVNGRIGPLQQYDKFYIYTNSYSFKVVNNTTYGTLALSDIPIGNIKWTDEAWTNEATPAACLYSKSNVRKLIQSLNSSMDVRDKNVLNQYVKPTITSNTQFSVKI